MYNLKNPKPIFFVVFALFAIFMLSKQSYARVDPKSVVGLWLIDESEDNIIPDLSGNGNDGAIKGSPKWIEGKFGDALQFNGTTDYVDCGNAESMNLGVFTVVLWANFPATQGWNHIVSKGSHVASGTPGSVNWGVMMRDAEARFLYEIYADTTWSGISSPAVGLKEWHHLTATYDGNNMGFYRNGVSLGNSTAKIKLDPTRNFRIAGRGDADATGTHFNGSVDEVAFLNVVLTVDDIQEIMQNGLEAALNINAVYSAGKSATTWGKIKEKH